ncbi:zinc metalloprotease [Couchioplanes azureus]|uniref:matrixin family metalloprotease n=1 Tax=Couchioplanes caeruleus TaxID=56438 RepID=UPI00166FC090|nr:matrixin family metalloprotease [Couchioplanes caeruleus]GGQ49723.1 hypothetical protein GCM10010166_17730 [Couchioplanes caeruleus subsp. azureus]
MSLPLRHRVAAVLAVVVTGCVPAAAVPAPATAAPAATASARAAAPGNRKAWATFDPRARWNPCAVIGYRFNPARAPKGALTDLEGAIRRISSATGLRFAYRGTTTAVPHATKGYNPDYPSDTQLVVAWVDPGKQSEWLPKNGPAGVGGPAWTTGYTAKGTKVGLILWAGVVLNTRVTLTGGFGAGPRVGWQGTRGQLLMHELGHAVGLDHPEIRDQKQIMYPMMTRKKAVWGAGDLTGLTVVGKAGGCVRRDPPASATALTGGTPAEFGAFVRS